MPAPRLVFLTACAMVAFAANSLLCRMALGAQQIDAASFTTVRLASGALALWLIASLTRPKRDRPRTDPLACAMLFTYAIAFSFAYLTLDAGVGALILFGAVQVTMLAAGLRAREVFTGLSWTGFALAVAGLVYLVSPGLSAPAPAGAALMSIAGIAWGIYSLRGRGSRDPLASTASNFAWAVPAALVVNVVFAAKIDASGTGLLLAVASGALASGVGYVIWYAALAGLAATRAATVQLSVPVIAAFGGVAWLGETMTLRLMLASAAILGGIALVLAQRSSRAGPTAGAGRRG